MRISQLRDLVAIVEAGSIRAAARSLGVSQPAMTKSLRQLEDQLHVRLLDRTTNGVIPTKAGHAFIARARAAQAELRKAEEELSALAGERAGAAAFGVGPFSGVILVPDALACFRALYPTANVRIVEGIPGTLLPQLRDGTLDFVVGRKPSGKLDAGVRYQPLLTSHLVVAGRREHPLIRRQSLRDLSDAPWLTASPPGARDLLEEAFAMARLPPPCSIVRCESYSVQMGILARTDALALLPVEVVRAPLARTMLREVRTTERIPHLLLGMFTRAQTRLAPVAAAMAKAIVATARTPSPQATFRA